MGAMNSVSDFIFIFANGFGVITGFLLSLFFSKAKKQTDRILALLILIITLRVLKSLIYYFYPSLSWNVINLTFALKLSIGPLLLFYIHYLLNKKKTLNKIDLLHFIPSFIMCAGFMHITRDSLNPFGFLFIYFQLLGYILYSFFYLKKMPESSKKKWAKTLVSVLFIIWCAYFLQLFFKTIPYLLASFLYSISLIYLTFKAQFIGSFSKAVQHEEKYESSKLDDQTKETLTEKILQYMNTDKPYLNASLTLQILAEETGTTTHELSEIINTKFQLNFNQFINAYRIELAKKLLLSTDKKVATIAFEVGFKSLSNFNTTFKKIESYTPSEYRKKLSES